MCAYTQVDVAKLFLNIAELRSKSFLLWIPHWRRVLINKQTDSESPLDPIELFQTPVGELRTLLLPYLAYSARKAAATKYLTKILKVWTKVTEYRINIPTSLNLSSHVR